MSIKENKFGLKEYMLEQNIDEAINKAKFLNAQSVELMIWNFNETSKKFFENYFKIRSLVLTKEL